MRRIHQLLKVGLNPAGHLISIAVYMNLADMINCRIWLARVSRAQLKEQGIADH